MARSKHTDPRKLRAARRILWPRQARGHADPIRTRRRLRRLKLAGLAPDVRLLLTFEDPRSPRIFVRRPRPGFLHPVSPAEVLRLLRFVGAEAIYGLSEVGLVQAPDTPAHGQPPLGRALMPGRIVLYEQPVPPWRLAGQLSSDEERRLRRAGAHVHRSAGGLVTTVEWPDESLRDFMLFDVLLHELGHHVLQHNAAKRLVRIARTSDHEAFADLFAERHRAAWQERPGR
jgi:hypothetical protein